jgi:hypothetical protein
VFGIANGYPMPIKAGYRFRGIKVQIGDHEEHHLYESFTISKEHITGPVIITAEWDKKFPITSADPTYLSDLVNGLKAGYENNDLYFKGFGPGTFRAGYDIPKREGYRFKGIEVQVGDAAPQKHLGNDAFTIPAREITGPIKITVLWDKEFNVTSADPELSAVIGNLKAYEDNVFKFPGFGRGGVAMPTKPGYKFRGVRVQNGAQGREYSVQEAKDGFHIKVEGDISITYLWEERSPITVDYGDGRDIETLDDIKFKGDTYTFPGVGKGAWIWGGYTDGLPLPERSGYKFIGVKVQIGDADPEEHLGKGGFNIGVQGPVKITYIWEEASPITFDTDGGSEEAPQVPANEFYYKDSQFRFKGFYTGLWVLQAGRYGYLPKKPGYKFLGVSVKNGNQGKEYLGDDAINGFNITVQGPIEITYLWEQEGSPSRKKSEESAQGAAQAAAEIGMLLGTQAAVSMFVANGPLKLMKNAMDSFAALERSQAIQVSEAQALVSQNNYSKGKTNEEILRQLLSNSELSPEDASMFLKLLSDVEIETSGEVMSYEPNTQDPSKPGKMHINYKMLRAMFLDANGNTQNIELFKVFVKHELTHMEFSTSDNPLYKAAHNIPFLEEFLVSFSDLYVWQQAQLILPEYTNIVKFIFTNARILSIAAGISVEEAERISKLYTGLPQKEMTMELLPTVQGQLSGGSTSVQTSVLRPLSLFVANASDGSLTPASIYADKFGGAASDYTTAVVEHIPSTVLVPTGYSRRMSVNVSFNGLVYDVYVRQNAQGKCFIGLKLKGGVDLEQNPTAAAQNFAAAAQYFANDLNTNTVLREELNRATNLGISAEGVAMMDFVGFPPAVQQTSRQLTQQLYESGDMSQGLAGVYTAWDLEIGEENLTTIEQDIRSRQIFKLDTPEKLYSLDLKTARLTNSEFIREAASIKKKEGATTIILNITDFDFETINSASVQENLKEIAGIIRSLGLRPIIQVNINKTDNYENLFRMLMGLGFEGISLEAGEVENIETIKSILEVLGQVSDENNITTDRNTIHLKNKAIKDALGDLIKYNVLAIVSIDEETHAAKIDEGAQLKAKDKGYLRGRRILEQKIDAGARNVRALLKLVLKDSSSVTPLEIREAVAQAGLADEAVKKHIEVLCTRASSDRATAATDVSVMEAVGFLRGFIESYALSQYLQAFDLSPEIFNMNASSDKQSLAIILTAALIIDSENQIFKSPSALKEFIGQAKTTFEQAQELSSATLANLRTQMITFANSIYKQMDEERDIDSIIRISDADNPYRKLYVYLAIANDLINTVSFRKVVEETGTRAKAPVSAVRNILGAA